MCRAGRAPRRELWAQDSIPKQQLDTQESLVRQLEGAVKNDPRADREHESATRLVPYHVADQRESREVMRDEGGESMKRLDIALLLAVVALSGAGVSAAWAGYEGQDVQAP